MRRRGEIPRIGDDEGCGMAWEIADDFLVFLLFVGSMLLLLLLIGGC